MKKRMPLFYKIYFASIALFFVLLVVFLIWLNGAVHNYNQSIPETISERFFDSTFKNLNPEKIIQMSDTKPSEFETEGMLKSYIETVFSGDISYTSVSNGKSHQKKYIVKSGEHKIAEYFLEKDAENKWAASKIGLFLPEERSKIVKILSSGKLLVNGKEVSEKYVTSTTDGKWQQYLPNDTQAPYWVTYTLPRLYQQPEIKVIDRNNNLPRLVEEKGIITEEIIYDQQEQEIVSRIKDGALQYAICMQNDAKKNTVYPYFKKGTELYKRIQSVETAFVWEHNGYDFEDVEISEYFRYDPSTISLRISYTHVLKMNGKQDYRNFADITYFAQLVDGKYMIFSCYNN